MYMLLNGFQAMDDFRSDLKRVNSKLDKILPKAMLTKNVLNLEISRTRHGTLAHYNMPDANPDSKGAFMVNDNVTFFNQVQFYFMQTKSNYSQTCVNDHPWDPQKVFFAQRLVQNMR